MTIANVEAAQYRVNWFGKKPIFGLLMAGKRQHFIPQFLQQGFASHTTGGATFTWVYRKGAEPYNPNIINVGVEGMFYTEGDDRQADDLITDAEGPLDTLVQALRESTPGSVSDTDIPRLIAHLEVRTRHARQNMLGTTNFFVSKFLDFMNDDEAFIRYLERQFHKDPSLLRDGMSKVLARQGLSQDLLPLYTRLTRAFLPAVMAQLKPMLPYIADSLRVEVQEKLNDPAKTGHIRSLKKAIAPELKTHIYEGLTYSVVQAADGPLLLGDSAVLFGVGGSKPYKTFLFQNDVLESVILPLTPTRALVGSRERVDVLPSDLRRTTARCSLEYFIASDRSDANATLRGEIGEDAALISTGEMEDFMTELMKE